jgi:hypothetical protein
VETFIAYCTNESTDNDPTDDEDDPEYQPTDSEVDSNHQSTDDEPTDDEPTDNEPTDNGPYLEGEFKLLAVPRPRPHSKKMDMTPDDTQLIFSLREENHLTWKHVKAHFPGRSTESIRNHNNLRRTVVKKSTRKIWTSDENCMLLDLKENTTMSLKQIAAEIPGTTPEILKKHYYHLKGSHVIRSLPDA